jgi:hypothetical protein
MASVAVPSSGNLARRRTVHQTVPVTDSGFSEEARRRARQPRPPATKNGRPSPTFVFFLVVVVGLLAFAGWAWAGRAHTDDLLAYDALETTITVMDRSIPPIEHSEVPPCRDSSQGVITRSYPQSTGPQAAEIVGYLLQKGWNESSATTPPVVATLTKVETGHQLTIDIVAPSRNQLVTSLTGRSPASALACLIR